MTGAGVAQAHAVCVLEPHGAGYRLWADGPFTRLVFAVPGVVSINRTKTADACYEVTLDPRFDRAHIEMAIWELMHQAQENPGIGRWAQ